MFIHSKIDIVVNVYSNMIVIGIALNSMFIKVMLNDGHHINVNIMQNIS